MVRIVQDFPRSAEGRGANFFVLGRDSGSAYRGSNPWGSQILAVHLQCGTRGGDYPISRCGHREDRTRSLQSLSPSPSGAGV